MCRCMEVSHFLKIMIEETPNEVLNAIIPEKIDCGEGVFVYPLTLSHYVMLEKIKSYLVISHEPDEIEILKSFYICTHTPKEVLKNLNELEETAIEWGSSLHPAMFNIISDAIITQIKYMTDVVPKLSGFKKKLNQKEQSQTD